MLYASTNIIGVNPLSPLIVWIKHPYCFESLKQYYCHIDSACSLSEAINIVTSSVMVATVELAMGSMI